MTFWKSKRKADFFNSPWRSFTFGWRECQEWWVIFIAAATTMTQTQECEFHRVYFYLNLQGRPPWENAPPVTSEPLISRWWPLSFPPGLPPKSRPAQLDKPSKSKDFAPFSAVGEHMQHDFEDKHISSFLYVHPLISVSSWASWRFLSAPSSSLTDEKQCALFHYTVNPISCFTLCRGAAERGNGWGDAGQCWHKSHNPWGNASCWGSPGQSRGIPSN